MGLYVKKCPKCGGSGRRPKRMFAGTRPCPACDGEGMTSTFLYKLLGTFLFSSEGPE